MAVRFQRLRQAKAMRSQTDESAKAGVRIRHRNRLRLHPADGNSSRSISHQQHPTWTDVKAKLADFDRAALLDLIRSLYSAHKDNQVFLHSRFGLGGDVLEPYNEDH